MKKTRGIALALAMCSFAAMADYVQNITLWRGETITEPLAGYAKVGDAPAGFEIKVGTAEKVSYLTTITGTHYSEVADRVVWGSRKAGYKVVSVTADATTPAGTYRCGDLNITVLDRVLPPPSQWQNYLDLWQHPWAVAREAGVEPFSPAHYAKMRPLWEMLAGAGCKVLTTTILDLPWNHQCYDAYHSMIERTKLADGSWKFDYNIFDQYVVFGRSCGLGPDIACYTMCPWGYMFHYKNEKGEACSVTAKPGSAEFTDYWSDFLRDFAQHLKAKGWFEHTYIAMDERSPEDVMNIAKLVQECAPGLKISLAGNQAPSNFKGITIDSACFGLGYLTDALIAEAADRKAKGMRTTFYVCCGPDYPNTFCSSEREESFWLGVYPAMSGLDGFLRWAWNSWPQDPISDASYGYWQAGDTFFVYPDGSPSLRFLELKNGIVAGEKLRILEAEGAYKDEIAALKKRFDRNEAMKNKSNFPDLRAKTQNLVNRK